MWGGGGGHFWFQHKWGDLKKCFLIWRDQNILADLQRILSPPCSIHNERSLTIQ
jgi:hypothetical protein